MRPIGKVLDAIAERMNWNAPFERGTGTLRRGRGLGIGFKASISPTTSGAIVNVSADGSVVVYTNTIDMGQGSDTAMAQIVAETLDIRTEDVKVVHGNTDVAPYDMGTLGSRSTFHMGNAVKRAAEDARAKLAALAAEVGLPVGTNYAFGEIFKKRYGMQAGNVIGTGTYIPSLQADRCQDRPVGQRHPVLDDRRHRRRGRGRHRDRPCPRAAPRQCRRLRPSAEPEGRAQPALGCSDHAARLHALRDHGVRRRPGHQRVASPTTRSQASAISPRSTSSSSPLRSRTARSVPRALGESGTFGVSPAIANAIHDAVGVRLTELPIRAEAVLRALREAEGRPIEADE